MQTNRDRDKIRGKTGRSTKMIGTIRVRDLEERKKKKTEQK